MRVVQRVWRMGLIALSTAAACGTAGAEKCGTTSMYRYVIQHPQVLPLPGAAEELDASQGQRIVRRTALRTSKGYEGSRVGVEGRADGPETAAPLTVIFPGKTSRTGTRRSGSLTATSTPATPTSTSSSFRATRVPRFGAAAHACVSKKHAHKEARSGIRMAAGSAKVQLRFRPQGPTQSCFPLTVDSGVGT